MARICPLEDKAPRLPLVFGVSLLRRGLDSCGFLKVNSKSFLVNILQSLEHVNTSAVALWSLTYFSVLIHGVHDLLKPLQLSLPSAEEKQWKLCNAPLGHTGFPEAK